MGLDVRFQQYRHISKCIVEEHLSDQVESKRQKLGHHTQAGHTSTTATNSYAGSNRSLPKVDNATIHTFLKFSLDWLTLLKSFNGQPRRKSIGEFSDRSSIIVDCTPSVTGRDGIASTTPREVILATPSFPKPNSVVVPVSTDQDRKLYEISKRIFGSGFLSNEQFVAVYETAFGSGHSVIILPTGSGKTLTFAVLPFLEPNCCTILISPFLALNMDISKRLTELKVPFQEYKEGCSITDLKVGSLLVVTPFQVGLHPFQNAFTYWVENKLVKRVIIDEIHEFLYSCSYRADTQNVTSIINGRVRVIMLTGTLPPCSRERRSLFLNHHPVNELRFPTTRPNIRYNIDFVDDINSSIIMCLNAFKGHEKDRILIYCTTTAQLKTLKSRIGKETTYDAFGFDGSMTEEQKYAVKTNWERIGTVMVATSAFGTGIDYKFIPLIIIVGGSYSLLDYAQMSGRGGRDGRVSTTIVYTNKHFLDGFHSTLKSNPTSIDQEIEFSKVKQVLQSKQCIRFQLQSYLDGRAFTCLSNGRNTVLCCNCLVHSMIS
jgi:superfamily II DNA helicase RecQ